MKKRLLTGDRPTGPLHLGHYLGSLRNRVKYLESQECFFVIADLHTLTTRPGKEQIARMNEYIHHIVLDYLAAGIDPDRSTIFVEQCARNLGVEHPFGDAGQYAKVGKDPIPEGDGPGRRVIVYAIWAAWISGPDVWGYSSTAGKFSTGGNG